MDREHLFIKRQTEVIISKKNIKEKLKLDQYFTCLGLEKYKRKFFDFTTKNKLQNQKLKF